MRAHVRTSTTLGALFLALACSGERKPEPPPPPAASAAPEAPPAPPSAPPPAAAPAPPAPPPAASEAAPPARPTPPAPPKEATAPSPAPAAPPAPPVETAPATPAPPAPPAAGAHARVGPDKCKMCHRLQHQSWAESPHAAKGLDCEGCHGNGGDYWSASVMRDREKALAAGLVLPTLESCRKCHAKADAALLAKVHAHKAR